MFNNYSEVIVAPIKFYLDWFWEDIGLYISPRRYAAGTEPTNQISCSVHC